MADYNDLDYYGGDDEEGDFYYDDEAEAIPIRPGASIFELYTDCLEPTFVSAFHQVLWLLCGCLLFRILSQIVPVYRSVGHLMSFFCGVMSLYAVIGPKFIATSMIGIGSYFFPLFCSRRLFGNKTKHFAICTLLLYLVSREYMMVASEAWGEVRGVQMIMVLKILSVSLELESGERNAPPPYLDYLGYIFCPGTVVFGPWVSFDVYCRIFEKKNWNIGWVIKVSSTALFSFLSLGVSSCVVYWLFLGNYSSWILAVRNAFSVRFSHYFVSFLSELTALLSGFSSDITVTKPWHIECPRSLVEVVVYWNKPMHTWLKTYIFRPASHLGAFKAVFLTFLVSSMLHGMNFGLTLVLLSLGFYTYVEHTLREKLASIFSACVRSRSCRNCKHTLKSHLLLVQLVNLCFGLLAFFNLAYLGIMLDKTHSENESSQPTIWETINEDWSKWSNLNFISHWTMIAVYVATFGI